MYDNIAYSSNDIVKLLPHIQCGKYIVTSSSAVYDPLEGEIKEEDFHVEDIVYKNEVKDKNRYAHRKRLREAAIYNKFKNENIIIVRFPYVVGENDYTNRLKTYVDVYMKGHPMYIDNLHNKMSFISSDEAGRFLAFLSTVDYKGPINAACDNQISIYDIFQISRYLITGDEFDELHEKLKTFYTNENIELKAPYNGTKSYLLNTDIVKGLGYTFSDINECMKQLVYYYYFLILQIKEMMI